MTPMQIVERLERLAKAATPGEWTILAPKKTGGAWGDPGDRAIMSGKYQIAEVFERSADGSRNGFALPSEANATYIAACSPSEILALCAAYRELADLLAVTADAMKGYIEDLEGHGACLNYDRSILLRIAAQALPPQEGK